MVGIRRRQNRLLSLVLENPALLGAGIDESTAILVRPDGKWEVLGESQVYVVDARKAAVTKASSNKLGGHGLGLHLLLAGDVFDPVAGQAFAYDYDSIGNRQTADVGELTGRTATYTANSLSSTRSARCRTNSTCWARPPRRPR